MSKDTIDLWLHQLRRKKRTAQKRREWTMPNTNKNMELERGRNLALEKIEFLSD